MNNMEVCYGVVGCVFQRVPEGTQDFNKSGKNFQMRKIRFFSLPAHENLMQISENRALGLVMSLIV